MSRPKDIDLLKVTREGGARSREQGPAIADAEFPEAFAASGNITSVIALIRVTPGKSEL